MCSLSHAWSRLGTCATIDMRDIILVTISTLPLHPLNRPTYYTTLIGPTLPSSQEHPFQQRSSTLHLIRFVGMDF